MDLRTYSPARYQAEELETNSGDHVVHRSQQARELELQPAHHELPAEGRKALAGCERAGTRLLVH